MAYWLVKSEPSVFSFDDIWRAPKRTTSWEGVRNYQARNMLRDQMKLGDEVFYYHSNCDEPGIVGVARVVREGYPDSFAFDKRSDYYDSESDPQHPRWFMVDIQAVTRFPRVLTLTELKTHPALNEFVLLRKGNRLSVMPVSATHWNYILNLVT